MEYQFKEMQITRKDNGKQLYLTRYGCEKSEKNRNLLMVHGLTYAQFVFDIKYKDYSMCEYFAQKGYYVWRLDLGGYGKSEKYENGWDVNTVNAAKDVICALENIRKVQEVEQVNLLGWSWGTMITAEASIMKADWVKKMVWLGPCFGGMFEPEPVTESFLIIDDEYINRIWRKNSMSVGTYDTSAVEPMLWNMWNVLAYRQKGERLRPAGGAKEIMEAGAKWLIQPEKVNIPVLILTGDIDFYVNIHRCYEAVEKLPEGSKLCHLPHAGHAMYLEKDFYKKTREAILQFLQE